ncbi:MAG: type II toxin-antitoxin system VapC family toxin [Bryobacteraceae bacterium]
MITAVDTNILLDILRPNEGFVEQSAAALNASASVGSLVVADMVYAELCAHFSDQGECDAFLKDAGIRADSLSREALFLGGQAFRKYRRRGGSRTTLLADLLVGAHATVQASQLLTRDRGFYRDYFPGLRLVKSGTVSA